VTALARMRPDVKRVGGWSYVVAAVGLALALLAGGAALLTALGVWDVSLRRAYWTAAVGASVFYGFASLAVWRQHDPPDTLDIPVWPWRVHKWTFNGMGVFVGWSAAYLLHARLRQQQDLSGGLFVLALIALLGVSGWLPATAVGFVRALGQLAQKAVDAVAKP
jgi:hypothetical protein